MSQQKIAASYFSQDVQEFIRLLHQLDVKYLITGGEAVIFYGHVRLTGDVDFFYDRCEENARSLFKALDAFWEGSIPGIENSAELTQEGLILQYGRPPNRIDLINRIGGVSFDEAWRTKKEAVVRSATGDIRIFFIGIEQLIQNKEAAGRPKDLVDLVFLRRCLERSP